MKYFSIQLPDNITKEQVEKMLIEGYKVVFNKEPDIEIKIFGR